MILNKAQDEQLRESISYNTKNVDGITVAELYQEQIYIAPKNELKIWREQETNEREIFLPTKLPTMDTDLPYKENFVNKFSWHPFLPLYAIALNDDSVLIGKVCFFIRFVYIYIYLIIYLQIRSGYPSQLCRKAKMRLETNENNLLSPHLEPFFSLPLYHSKQTMITQIEFNPVNGSIIAVLCQNGIAFWTFSQFTIHTYTDSTIESCWSPSLGNSTYFLEFPNTNTTNDTVRAPSHRKTYTNLFSRPLESIQNFKYTELNTQNTNPSANFLRTPDSVYVNVLYFASILFYCYYLLYLNPDYYI